MVKKWNITIPELTGKQERRAYLYLPSSYEEDLDRHYPVLYMFDGHNVFFDEDATYGKSWGMKEYMDHTQTELIIAAVECNHSPDHGRLKEYSPFTFQDSSFGRIVGKGKKTMEWLVHSFKKEIDRNYRTLPDRQHTFIAGSSMGGLMSLYAIMEYNRFFSRAAALSPSVWANSERILTMIKRAKIAPDTVVYMDYGSRELPYHPVMAKQLEKVTTLLLRKKVMLDFRIVPGGNHSEASWEKQIPFFMKTLLYED